MHFVKKESKKKEKEKEIVISLHLKESQSLYQMIFGG